MKLAGKVVNVLIYILLGVAVSEGWLRYLYTKNNNFQVEMNRYTPAMTRAPANKEVWRENIPGAEGKFMGVDLKFNSHGFRGGEFPLEKPENEYRVMLLGDSPTMGWGAKYEDTFAVKLETMLNQYLREKGSAKKARVINAGVCGANTAQETAFLAWRGMQFKPDLVILNYSIDDAETPFLGETPFLLRHSYFAIWLNRLIDGFNAEHGSVQTLESHILDIYLDGKDGWVAAQNSIVSLKAQTDAKEIGFFIALIPELNSFDDGYAFKNIHSKVAARALMYGIERVVDLAPAFINEKPEDMRVAEDDYDPSVKAHAIIAREMFKYIKDNRFLENQGR